MGRWAKIANSISMKRISIVILISICLLMAGCEEEPPEIGKVAPEFVLPDLNGKMVRLSDFRGKVVAIRFWFSGCSYCIKGMPATETIYKKYKDKGLVILGVNMGETDRVVRDTVERLKISYPILLDKDNLTAKRYRITGVPYTYILDRDGVVRERILGEAPIKAFEQMVTKLL